MHAVALHHPLVEYTVKEIEEKIEEERGSGSGYLDCFNFKSDLQTGQRTLIGMGVQSFQQLTGANFIFCMSPPDRFKHKSTNDVLS